MAKENAQENAKRYYEPQCPVTRPILEWQVNEDGHHILVKTGDKNFDDEIQLYKDQCDIKILVDKLMNGDPVVTAQLNAPRAYGDVNNFPEEYHPAAGSMALHQLYENQPAAIKEKYPTYELFEQYFVNLTAQMVSDMFAPKQEAQESEVNSNEQ